jgi:hypothetical protein
LWPASTDRIHVQGGMPAFPLAAFCRKSCLLCVQPTRFPVSVVTAIKGLLGLPGSEQLVSEKKKKKIGQAWHGYCGEEAVHCCVERAKFLTMHGV